MGAKAKKATKRFQKQQSKSAVQKKGKKPFKKRAAHHKTGGHEAAAAGGIVDAQPAANASMGLDDFLDGGFEDLAGSDSEQEEEHMDSGSESEELSEELGGSEEGDDEEDEDLPSADGDEEGVDDDESGEVEEEESAAAAGDVVAQDNKRLRGEVSRHKAQLEALRQKDPEFYKYLSETDAGLLDFGDGEDDDEDEEEEEEEEDEEDEGEEKPTAVKHKKAAAGAEEGEDEEEDEKPTQDQAEPSGRTLVTSALVSQWVASVRKTGSLASLRHLVKAYRQACHYGDNMDQADDSMRIASGAVYNAVMMFMLREGDEAFRRCLGVRVQDTDKPLTHQEIAKSPRWKKVGPLVKSYLGNSMHALAAMTDPPLLTFTLRRLRASAPFMTPQPLRKFADKLLKASLNLWGTSEAAAPRLQAFLAIRQLAITMPHPFIEKVLRGAYKTFLANTKFVSAASAPHVAFMITCAVELWGLDMQASYAHAFSAVRQLAVSLRGALNMKSQEAYKQIYSWQGVCALELWARVLGAHAAQPALKPLVYPTVQLLLGAARLIPTPRFFPLRLRVLRATQRLAEATGAYVPLAAPLLDMLHWAQLHKAPKGGAGQCPDLALQLRAGKNLLKTSGFQEEVVTQVMELLAEHLSQWSCHPALPELSHLSALQLRRFAKATRVDKFRKAAKGLLDALDRNVAWVGAERDRADFAPRDVAKAAAFLQDKADQAPLKQYAKQLAARAAQRAAARSADSVDLLSGSKRKRDQEQDKQDEEQDEDGDMDTEEVESEEGQGEEEKPQASKKAKGAVAKSAIKQLLAGDEQEEDLLQEFQLSNDDMDEDTAPKTKANGALQQDDSDDEDSDDDEEDSEEEDSDVDEVASDQDGESDEDMQGGDDSEGGDSEGDDDDDGGPPAAKQARGAGQAQVHGGGHGKPGPGSQQQHNRGAVRGGRGGGPGQGRGRGRGGYGGGRGQGRGHAGRGRGGGQGRGGRGGRGYGRGR